MRLLILALLITVFAGFTIVNSQAKIIQTSFTEKTTIFVATGDIMLGRSVNHQSIRKNNFRWAFEKTHDLLKDADITLINLEGPLIPNCPISDEGLILCGDPKMVEGLIFAGVDVVNLANNHMEDYGQNGIDSTIAYLENSGIRHIGIKQPTLIERNGITFSFLGYNDINQKGGSPHIMIENITEEINSLSSIIKQTKDKADVVIVSFHWGTEYTRIPTQRQKEIAYAAADAGADLIIGHHPHWVQSMETYNGVPIIYSHGNFVFDQMWSQKTREGIVSKITFQADKIIDIKLIPILIEDFGQPVIME